MTSLADELKRRSTSCYDEWIGDSSVARESLGGFVAKPENLSMILAGLAALEERDKLREAMQGLLDVIDHDSDGEPAFDCWCTDTGTEYGDLICEACKARALLQPTPEQTKETT